MPAHLYERRAATAEDWQRLEESCRKAKRKGRDLARIMRDSRMFDGRSLKGLAEELGLRLQDMPPATDA
jgi:hypothetical protein